MRVIGPSCSIVLNSIIGDFGLKKIGDGGKTISMDIGKSDRLAAGSGADFEPVEISLELTLSAYRAVGDPVVTHAWPSSSAGRMVGVSSIKPIITE
jgi:hypothetical protein